MKLHWKKLGKIFDPRDHQLPQNCEEFAQSPQGMVLQDRVRIFFSAREREPSVRSAWSRSRTYRGPTKGSRTVPLGVGGSRQTLLTSMPHILKPLSVTKVGPHGSLSKRSISSSLVSVLLKLSRRLGLSSFRATNHNPVPSSDIQPKSKRLPRAQSPW